MQKWDRKTSSRPFYKDSKFSISLDQQPKISYSLFLLYVQVEVHQNILKLTCWSLTFTLYKAFLKGKKGPGTSLFAPFSGWFLERKYFSRFFLLTCYLSLSVCLYFYSFPCITKKSGQRFELLTWNKNIFRHFSSTNYRDWTFKHFKKRPRIIFSGRDSESSFALVSLDSLWRYQ